MNKTPLNQKKIINLSYLNPSEPTNLKCVGQLNLGILIISNQVLRRMATSHYILSEIADHGIFLT